MLNRRAFLVRGNWSGNSRRDYHPTKRRLRTLRCESLEQRQLLAVTSLMDAGAGSLRAEIAATAAGGTVTFMPGLAGTITLTSGELVVDKALTIDASGATVTVSGNNVSRIFLVDDGVDTTFQDVTIRNLTISDGVATDFGGRFDGGGILSFENLTMDTVTLSNNRADNNVDDDGGGMSHGNEDRPAGDLILLNCILENNTSFDDGGAIDFYNARDLTIEGTQIRNNQVGGSPLAVSAASVGALRVIHAGGADPLAASNVTIRNSSFEGNTAVGSPLGDTASIGNAFLISGDANGTWNVEISDSVISGNVDVPDPAFTHYGYGAIDFDSITNVTIRNSQISGNFSTVGGGALYLGGRYAALTATLDGVTVENNGMAAGGGVVQDGGGVYIYQPSMAYLVDVTFEGGSISNNRGVRGGGVFIEGGATVTMNGTTISGNTAERGGGIFSTGGGYNGNVIELNNVTINGNTATFGGGGLSATSAYLYVGSITVRDSTISRNVVTGDPSDPTLGNGGGIELSLNDLTVEQSTISGNQAVLSGGGIFGGTDVNSVNITRSTITGNTANSDSDATGTGGGIHLTTATMPILLDNTILAGNSDLSASGAAPDLVDNGLTVAATSSFVGTNAGSTLLPSPGPNTPDASGNLIGGGANGVLNPDLGALGNNGGPTETHLPNMGSPVVDRGSGTRTTDQRGEPGVVGAAVDMGSVERGTGGPLNLDFNNDGMYNCDDMNLLEAAIDAGTYNAAFDVNMDQVLNSDDVNAWLMDAGELRFGAGRFFLPGDANLSGAVDGSDFGIWNMNKFTSASNWCQGDFNQSGAVDGSDFGIWNANKFRSSDASRPVGAFPPADSDDDSDDRSNVRENAVESVFADY